MKEKKGIGWKVSTVLLAVLLAGAAAAIVVLAISSSNTKSKDKNKISSLEKKVAELEKEIVSLKAKSAKLVIETSSVSTSSATQTEPGASDEEIVNEMALERAKKANSNIPWSTGGTKVIGDYARVGVGSPREYNMQGESVYFHKVNGTWTFVDSGTGLTQAELPGFPEELINP